MGGRRWLFIASYIAERAAPNEAEVPPPLHPVRATSNQGTSGIQGSRQSRKKKKRKGKDGGDDDSKFSSTALQPASNARGCSAPQHRFLLLEHEGDD